MCEKRPRSFLFVLIIRTDESKFITKMVGFDVIKLSMAKYKILAYFIIKLRIIKVYYIGNIT